MAKRKICIDEITTITRSFTETVTCTNPSYTPTAPGNNCNTHIYNIGLNLSSTPPVLSFSYDSQFEYQFHNPSCSTFSDYCDVLGSSGSITLPSEIKVCCDGGASPSIEANASCNPGSITTTPTSVSGSISLAFTVTNLCTPTIICIDDTTCP